MGAEQENEVWRTASTDCTRSGLWPFSRRNRPTGAGNSDRGANSDSRRVIYSAPDSDSSPHGYPSANGNAFEPAAYSHTYSAAANTNPHYSASYTHSPASSDLAAHQRAE
jgi:hypothetical protein